ncbi:MAG: PEP-CTERM sorting domain-containing protein [Verrucomicrobiaceae bacterium]|nr:MAG: PEP-CTERM sorting domain-containing protein [Verrucomicrobiaceae bacterium]
MKCLRIPFSFLFYCAVAGLSAGHASAAAVLAVDFGRNDSLALGVAGTAGGSALKPGFQGFYLTGSTSGGNFTGVASLTYGGIDSIYAAGGSIEVSVQGDPNTAAGSMGGRDRNNPLDNGAFTYGDMLRDGIARTRLTNSAGDYSLKLSGLVPGASFSLTLWTASSGSDSNTSYTWYDTSIGSTSLGSIYNGPQSGGIPLTAASNLDFSITSNVTANGDGEILLGVIVDSNSATAAFINGFELNAIPEPSAALLLGGLSVAAGFRRRRA